MFQLLLPLGDIDIVAYRYEKKDEGILGSQKLVVSSNKVIDLMDPLFYS